jgi:hypothetical protein
VYASVKTRRSFSTTSSIDPSVGEFVALRIAHHNQIGAAGPHIQLGDRRGLGHWRKPLF